MTAVADTRLNGFGSQDVATDGNQCIRSGDAATVMPRTRLIAAVRMYAPGSLLLVEVGAGRIRLSRTSAKVTLVETVPGCGVFRRYQRVDLTG